MAPSDEPAVVVGGGLTGMAISWTLTQAAIPHVVIGAAPGPLPRLGESLNLEGTILFDQFCGEFKEAVCSKNSAVAYLGDYVLTCDFNIGLNRRSRNFFKIMGTFAPSELLHIDRLGLDSAMWERMITSPYCTVIDAKVQGVGHTPAGLITTIELSDGTTLSPRYVFDASNHKRVIAEAIDVPVTLIGKPQRVVHTHFHPAEKESDSPRSIYDRSTNLLRLFGETDGVDAMAWYIPLPHYLSIGVSMEDGSNDFSDEEMLQKVEEAYARRGLTYRDRYPETAPIMSLRHRYFAHERAYGPNWVLAGGTYASVWWLAGAGVGTSFVAGQMAAELVADPEGAGHVYEQYLRDLVPIHDTFDWFVYATPDQMAEAELIRQSDGFVRTNVSRLASASRMSTSRVSSVAGTVLSELVRREVLPRNYCRVSRADLPTQTERAFGPLTERDDEAVVLQLTEVIAGRLEPGWVEQLLAPDVVSHVDGLTAKGQPVWKEWLHFLRTRPGMRDLELVDVEPHTLADGRIVAVGHWKLGTRTSGEVSATYRVHEGRIVEVWTSKTNYEFILGPRARSTASMVAIGAWMGLLTRVHHLRSSH
jgi:flavin-dependent dehydrogenase